MKRTFRNMGEWQWCIGWCFLLVIVSNTGLAQQSVDSTDQHLPSPRGALIRSAIIPGWGQFHNGKYVKSTAYFATHAWFAYEFYHENRKLRNTTEASARKQIKYNRNTWGWRFLAAYVLCLTDAYVDAQLAGFPEDDNDVSLHVSPANTGWRVQLNLSF